MKNLFYSLAISLFIVFLSSCGGGGAQISEVDLIPVSNGEEFQYIDKEGKIVINPQFSEATVFREGLALVKTSGSDQKWGFISEDGKFVILATYLRSTVFSEGLAWVVAENGAPSAIDKKGEIKVTMQDAERVNIFKEGLASYSVVDDAGTKCGFVDKEGKVIINPQFSQAGNFSGGKCIVMNSDGKWGYIDKEGKLVINYQFESAGDFIHGKAVVSSGGKTGLIDSEGKYVINPQFSNMVNDGNIYLIEQSGKWGWCDKDGVIIINPQFREAYPFLGKDLAAVQSGDSYAYIDLDGKIIINPQFDQALPFNGKLALVASGRKYGFIDNDGKYIINPQFEDISRDYVTYLINGGSTCQSVETDYFNLSAITAILNVESPEGFTFNSTFEDVMKKLNLSESDFNQYRTENIVINSKRITNDASYTFYVIGNCFDQVQVQTQNGWGSYNSTEYRFNNQLKPQTYAYMISLSGKGYGKSDQVISAMQGLMGGLKKDETRSSEQESYYSDGKKFARIFARGNNVYLVLGIEITQESVE